MIGLVIVTHAAMGEGLLDAATMILGPQESALVCSTGRGESTETMHGRLAGLIEEAGRDGDGVVILADMFGGTPANLSLDFFQPGRIDIVTGVNLPMLLKFFSYRQRTPLTELLLLLKETGRQGVILVSETIDS